MFCPPYYLFARYGGYCIDKKLIKPTLQLFVGVEGIEPTCNRLPFLLCIRQRGYAPSLYVSPYCHQSRMHAVLSPFGSAYPNPELT